MLFFPNASTGNTTYQPEYERQLYIAPFTASVASFLGALISVVAFGYSPSMRTPLLSPVLFMALGDLLWAVTGILSYTPAVLNTLPLHNISSTACSVVGGVGNFALQIMICFYICATLNMVLAFRGSTSRDESRRPSYGNNNGNPSYGENGGGGCGGRCRDRCGNRCGGGGGCDRVMSGGWWCGCGAAPRPRMGCCGPADSIDAVLLRAAKIEPIIVFSLCTVTTATVAWGGFFGVAGGGERYECWVPLAAPLYARLSIYVPLIIAMVFATGTLLWVSTEEEKEEEEEECGATHMCFTTLRHEQFHRVATAEA